MAGVKIKDAPLVEQVTGTDKIPVSDGSEQPKTVSVEQIKNYTLDGVASSEALSSAIANHDASENAHAPLMTKIQESIDAVKGDVYTKSEVDAKIPAPVDTYTKTEADNKFALLSNQPYFFNPSVLNSLSTNSSRPASDITGLFGITLREFVANYGDRIVFKGYMGALAYSQDSAGTLAEFTYYVNDKIRVVKIIHEDADTTCNVTVTEKQLVTNIVAISESDYATISKDSSTLYLVY